MFVEAENCSATMEAKRSEAANSLYKPDPDDCVKPVLSNEGHKGFNKKRKSTLHSADDETSDAYILKPVSLHLYFLETTQWLYYEYGFCDSTV